MVYEARSERLRLSWLALPIEIQDAPASPSLVCINSTRPAQPLIVSFASARLGLASFPRDYIHASMLDCFSFSSVSLVTLEIPRTLAMS